jgi:hypothetical protein
MVTKSEMQPEGWRRAATVYLYRQNVGHRPPVTASRRLHLVI